MSRESAGDVAREGLCLGGVGSFDGPATALAGGVGLRSRLTDSGEDRATLGETILLAFPFPFVPVAEVAESGTAGVLDLLPTLAFFSA